MQLERSHNAKQGIIHGFINKIILLVLPFIVQTIMIRTMGAQYLGIKGLFTSILQVFSLAELGFGTAIVYSMYQPISTGNTEELCALLKLYKRIYRYIGWIILILGLSIVPFLKNFISGEYPENLNLVLVYLLYLANTVLTYWLFAYKTSLFNAYQRYDIVSKISTITTSVMYLFQIMILLVIRNYYMYLIVAIICTVLNNLLINHEANRQYPQIKCCGNVDKKTKSEIKKKVMGLLIYKVCDTTRNSFDSIFISMFLGLTLTAMYSNYFYVITAVAGVLSIITSSLLAGVGNSIKLDSVEKNRNDMQRIDWIYMLISGWCMICIICLYQPFMEVWVGTELQFPFAIAIMFGVYFYLLKMGDIRALYADAAGLWWENRFRTIAEAIANIILNYLFVLKWGIYGIIGATLITIFIFGFIAAAYVLFKYYFKKGLASYFIQHGFLAVITGIVCLITYKLCTLYVGNTWIVLIVRLLICCGVSPMIYYILLCRNKCFKDSITWALNKIRL